MKKFSWLMSRGALLSIGLLAFLASCPGTTDDENGGTTQPSFTYSSGVTAESGMAQDAVSSAPTWTNLPAGTVTYSIERPPDGSNLNVEPAVGNDGAVTVPKDAHAATEDWTVTAAAGGSAYTAKITITVSATTQPSFTYSSGVTAEFGMAQDAASPAPTWTNLPAGTVTYSIEGPPGGSNLNVTPAVGNDGAVTVPKDAHAAAEDWTVTAAAGDSAYTAKITITVNPKEHTAGTVSYSDAVISAKTDFQIAPRVPSLTDALPSGAAAVYTVDPALPAGMDLDPATGEITGTPEAEQAETEHTVTLTLTGNYSGTATASITVTVTADARAPWVESLVYDTASVFVEVKGGAVAGAVTIAPPVLTQKTDVTSPITAEYSSVENRAAVDSSTGEITISDGTDLSDIDGNDFTFNIKVIDSGGAYADFQETVTVNLQKVKSITFGTPPALTYGDGPQMLTAPAVDAANGADTTVTYSTSNAAVADVDSVTGELTIAAAGEVTITATSTFDTSVEGAQTLTIAQKDINALTNLTSGDLTAYVGIEFSGAITVSGLIGSDTMAEALSFVPITTGTVRVAADGVLTIPVQNNTDNHDTVHNITVNGTGSYTGSKVIQVTLKVLDSYFSYTSGIETTYGTEGQSLAPVWTNPPAGTIVYSLEGSPQGVSVDVATGVVTVGPTADVRTTVQITVKAAVAETKEYSASLTVTVTAKDIATVTGFSISVDDKTATAKSTDSTHSAVIGGTLAATTDYTLQITDSSNNVPDFMSIDANGDITIADSIAVSDGGTYTVTAAGTGSYSGTTNADFTLTVEPKDIATVTGFSISVDDKTATAKSTDKENCLWFSEQRAFQGQHSFPPRRPGYHAIYHSIGSSP